MKLDGGEAFTDNRGHEDSKSSAWGTHARTIKVSAALGVALSLLSIPSDAFAPLRQWMLDAFDAEYHSAGPAVDLGDAIAGKKTRESNDAAIQVALAAVGPIRLATSANDAELVWSISDTPASWVDGRAESAESDTASDQRGFARSGFRAGAEGRTGGQTAHRPATFGMASNSLSRQHLADTPNVFGMGFPGGLPYRALSDSPVHDDVLGGETQVAGAQARGNPNTNGGEGGKSGSPIGAPNASAPSDHTGSPAHPGVTGGHPSLPIAPVSGIDDAELGKGVDAPVLQDLSLPPLQELLPPVQHLLPALRDLSPPSDVVGKPAGADEDSGPDLTRLHISDDPLDTTAAVPVPGTLLLMLLPLPMLLFFRKPRGSSRG